MLDKISFHKHFKYIGMSFKFAHTCFLKNSESAFVEQNI